MVSWFDEHGPRAVAQILPDGDFTQTGVNWNKQWLPGSASAAIPGSARPIGTLLLVAAHSVRSNLLFSLGRGSSPAEGTLGSAGVHQHLERV